MCAAGWLPAKDKLQQGSHAESGVAGWEDLADFRGVWWDEEQGELWQD